MTICRSEREREGGGRGRGGEGGIAQYLLILNVILYTFQQRWIKSTFVFVTKCDADMSTYTLVA